MDASDKTVKSKKMLIIVGVAVLLLGTVGWAIYQAVRSGDEAGDGPVSRSTVCTEEYITRYNRAMDPQDTSELIALGSDIRDQSDYQGDINCLYILIRERLARGQADEAEQRLKQLQQLSDSNIELSADFRPPALEYGVIAAAIKNLRQAEAVEPNPVWDEA